MPSVSLSAVRRADAAELVRANLEARAHLEPWAYPFMTPDGFEAWFGAQATGANAGFVARAADTGRLVGVTHVSQIVLGHFRSAYLGYHGVAASTGRGLMTEAVRLTAVHAFAELGLHRLEANIQPDNARSIALVRRVGFHREGFSPRYLRIGGVWCDHERWALLADELPG